jgi:hypothetical protein
MIVDAVRTAVNNACDQYNPSIGSNATTFGVDVYNFGINELKKLVTKQPQIFRYLASGNLFRLFVEGFELAFHRVGYDVSEGIENSFPNNEGAVSRILFQQEEQLAFVGEGFDIQPSKKYVLGHFADPAGGLSGVYLCKPSKKANAIAWDVTHELWKTDIENKEFKPTMKPKVAPVEKLGDIKLQPKEKLGEILLFPREEKGTMKLDHE